MDEKKQTPAELIFSLSLRVSIASRMLLDAAGELAELRQTIEPTIPTDTENVTPSPSEA